MNIPRDNMNAKVLDPSSILAMQFQGVGQVVEFFYDTPEMALKLALCNIAENNWVIILFVDK